MEERKKNKFEIISNCTWLVTDAQRTCNSAPDNIGFPRKITSIELEFVLTAFNITIHPLRLLSRGQHLQQFKWNYGKMQQKLNETYNWSLFKTTVAESSSSSWTTTSPSPPSVRSSSSDELGFSRALGWNFLERTTNVLGNSLVDRAGLSLADCLMKSPCLSRLVGVARFVFGLWIPK